jgi:hypothetical protein
MAVVGVSAIPQSQRFLKYLALIGSGACFGGKAWRAPCPYPEPKHWTICRRSLDKGYPCRRCLDYEKGLLLMATRDLRIWSRRRKAAPAGMEREDAILREIREVNDSILNPSFRARLTGWAKSPDAFCLSAQQSQ